MGSIRDPWSWYVSLWAYGCVNRGGVYQHTTRPLFGFKGLGWRSTPALALKLYYSTLLRDPGKWQRSYRDVNDVEGFRSWLSMVLDYSNRFEIGEAYGFYPLSRFAGLLSYRYMYLYCCFSGQDKDLKKITTPRQLTEYEQDNCFVDYFIRNENLESDLFVALESIGIAVSDEKKLACLAKPRTNASPRKIAIADYYDAALEQRVAQQECLVIDKFGYVKPGLS